jgi:hypothetical protein
MAYSRSGCCCLGGFVIAAALILIDVLVAGDLVAQVCLNKSYLDLLPPQICAAPLPSPLQIRSALAFPTALCFSLHLPTSPSAQLCSALPSSNHQQIQLNKASLHQALARRLRHHLGFDFERLEPPANGSTSTFRFPGVLSVCLPSFNRRFARPFIRL